MRDKDGDGYGDSIPPAGVTPGTDCDDSSADAADTFPGAADIDGPLNCMKDSDGDEYGDSTVSLPIVAGTDCDDTTALIFPGGGETPDDGIDQDCNGVDTITCNVDADGDGFGNDAGLTTPADDGTCDTGQGESSSADDCNDAEAGCVARLAHRVLSFSCCFGWTSADVLPAR